MDRLFSTRYIGSFEELPETAEYNDVALSRGFTYIWQDSWHKLEPIYKETLLDKMIKTVREAKDSELKRELEKLIEEDYKRLIGEDYERFI